VAGCEELVVLNDDLEEPFHDNDDDSMFSQPPAVETMQTRK
jgi:hypothetical protein